MGACHATKNTVNPQGRSSTVRRAPRSRSSAPSATRPRTSGATWQTRSCCAGMAPTRGIRPAAACSWPWWRRRSIRASA
ncbi:hypothetical protein ACFFX0_12660 [Citricoccus parietis]|uniref:Uncharacterized protein n=1 Tax=Citricoccus parietis TaxID=592307 RepID=A0ABV5FZB4_9MICC